MNVLEAFILGLVQGLTEFLPVSSSGHSIIAGKILGLSEVPVFFELTVHLATLICICIVMRKRILSIARKPLGNDMRKLALASAVTVIIVLLFESFFRSAFDGRYLIYCFLITAILLTVSGFRATGDFSKKNQPLKKNISYLDAAIIGLLQGAAVLPGISRSGSTISASTLLGNEKEQSAEFSFLISIPVIVGSSIIELISNNSALGIGAAALTAGFIAALISGFVGITLFLRLFKSRSMDGFAIYLLILSAFLILNDYFLHIF